MFCAFNDASMLFYREWTREGLKDLRDLVTYYVLLDTVPLRLALERVLLKFGEQNIPSLFSFFVSLAQTSWHNLYTKSLAKDRIWLLTEPLYNSMRKSLCGVEFCFCSFLWGFLLNVCLFRCHRGL